MFLISNFQFAIFLVAGRLFGQAIGMVEIIWLIISNNVDAKELTGKS